MSEQPPGYGSPPPPPAAYPPPQYGAPLPGQVPPPFVPMAAAAGGVSLMYQFGGFGGWSVLLGLASIVVPIAFGYVFYVLPVFGIIAGVRGIMRGRIIGGIVGIVLNCIGGLITIVALTAR